MSDEEEVLLLPGLPMVNRVGGNPEPDLWTFDVETAAATGNDVGSTFARPLIDYVHPGDWLGYKQPCFDWRSMWVFGDYLCLPRLCLFC